MAANIIFFYLTLAALWIFFIWLHHDYRVDLLRFRVFIARDKLFTYAEQGKISFDAPAYNLTRRMLNGSLRFAHRMTLSNIIVVGLLQKQYNPKGGEKYHVRLKKSLHGLSFEQKKMILEIHTELHFYMLSHVVNVSPLLFPLTLPLKMAIRLHWLSTRWISRKSRKKMESIDAVIYDLGNDGTAYC